MKYWLFASKHLGVLRITFTMQPRTLQLIELGDRASHYLNYGDRQYLMSWMKKELWG